jgi:hypothetical protein
MFFMLSKQVHGLPELNEFERLMKLNKIDLLIIQFNISC